MYAKVIEDSISPRGHRLTTMEVEFWRPILPEFNTYRQFSRSSASSRARPLKKLKGSPGTLDEVINNPTYPSIWTSEQPGMTGGPELSGVPLELAQSLFSDSRDAVVKMIEDYLTQIKILYGEDAKANTAHKSLINRLIEPYMSHKAIMASTSWDNFFNQRIHKDAQGEIMLPAIEIKKALDASTPRELDYGDFHTPYISDEEREELELVPRIKTSIARCARVSYLNHDGTRDISKDVGLFDNLRSQNPPHYAPMEMVATPAKKRTGFRKTKVYGNFYGWHQVRHHLEDLGL